MEDERIECRWFTRRELAAMIRSGQIEDGKTLVGYYMWRDRVRQEHTELRAAAKLPGSKGRK
jgi:hypothetical protein